MYTCVQRCTEGKRLLRDYHILQAAGIHPGSAVQTENLREENHLVQPPYKKDVKTKVGERFLCLITKHFPAGSKLHKIFNRHTVKISYSCRPNMATLIKRHNARVCNPAAREDPMAQRCCNCSGGKRACLLRGECLAKGVVYEASVTVEGGGPTRPGFKFMVK